MNKCISTIAIDLTPVLPGGENGGAKIFVVELLHQLAKSYSQTQFVLLTQSSSHDELAVLDRPNMRRQMVVVSNVTNPFHLRLLGHASRFLPYLPEKLGNAINSLANNFNTTRKHFGSGTLLKNMNADLLFCPFTAPTYSESGIPTICTIYDLQFKIYPEFFTLEEVYQRDRIFSEACRRSVVLSAISNYSREAVIAHININPDRIHTIYMRTAKRFILKAEQDSKILNIFGLIPKKYFLYPANFWKHKNHEMLLTSFGIACNQGLALDIKLVCTGAPGQRRDWLIEAAQKMNLADRVIFPGYLPDAELATLMANCGGLIFPSLYEGFGLPVIEAMAAGVPVACSNSTSLPEVAGDAAIFFDPRIPTQIAQAMISLADDEVLRSHLIKAGLKRAMEFSDTERMAREYWQLFQCAISNTLN